MKILNKILSASVALALATSFIACSSDDDDDSGVHTNYSKGVVSGVVTEYGVDVGASTAVVKGVKGAKVTMGKYTATTDDNGVWTIKGVEPGKYVAYVSKDGYSEAKTATEITVDAKTYEDLKLASSNALKEELLKTIANLGITNPATSGVLSGNLGGTIEEEAGAASTTTTTTTGYSVDPLTLSWFNTNVAEYNYEYAIVADAMSITPLTAGLKGTLKLRSSSVDNVNVTETTAGKDITLYFYDAAKSSLYATAKTNDKGAFEVKTGLPAYAAATALTILADPFVVDGQVYGTTAAKGIEGSPVLLPKQVIDVQTLCFAGKNVEDCVIVTETNVGAKTVSAPISLTTPISFTFDREIVSIDFTIADETLNTTYTVEFSADKKTVTLKPVSKWKGSATVKINKLTTADNYTETALVKDEYTTNFDKTFFATSSTLEDLADKTAPKPVEVLATADIVVEFSKELDYVSALTFGDYKAKDVKVEGNKITLSPKADISGVNKFTATSFTVTVVAKDGSRCTYKKETFAYATFKLLTVEIVEKSAARAITVDANKALKLTYSQEVKEVKDVKLGGKDAVTEVRGNVVYIDFNDSVNTETGLYVSGRVVSKLGEEDDLSTAVTETFQNEVTYKIVSANWGATTDSVNGDLNKIAATELSTTDSIVLTFNKEFAEGSTVTAELYKGDPTGVAVDKASYATEPTVAGNVVTIKPAAALEKNTTYFVAFSVAKDGVTAFTTKRGMEVPEAYSTILDSTTKKYITFKTKAGVTLKKGVNDKTSEAVRDTTNTKKILPTDSIVLEYDGSVEEYGFIATTSAIADQEKTLEEYKATSNYLDSELDATITLDASKTIVTVKANGVLAVEKVYVSRYDEKGKYIDTKAVTVDKTKTTEEALKAPKLPKFVLDEKVKSKIDYNDTTVAFTLKVPKVAEIEYTTLKSVKSKYGTYDAYENARSTVGKLSATEVLRDSDTVKPIASKVKTDMTYGAVKYIASAVIKGIAYVSEPVDVEDKVNPDYTSALPSTLTGTSVTVTDFKTKVNGSAVYTLVANEPVKTVSIQNPTGTNKVKADYEFVASTNNSFDVTISNADNALAGDKIVITMTDLNGNSKETTINIVAD
ncbi:MAG: Ig-like domain-containing protein [Treponema sp.]|nr:Ig-like domain-containing protein [Candidatus Treponema equifaecale]